ncbi:DUF2470 domain-containing protein [Streptomyces sp. NPDC101393]|uniref:DUF2470 domain-containing protein n=1 Tax=Streptomyces sp. NPDC101393 TaxID=3366141 RepID=UPI00382C1F7C
MKGSHRTEPTTAERARSILAAAGSLTVITKEQRHTLIGLHAVGPAGQLTLTDLPDRHLHTEIADAPRGDLAAVLEFTDVVPTVVRDRIRARLTLGGYLTATATQGRLRFTLTRAALTEAGEVTDVGLDELALAEPDPLATFEAELLTHLDAARADTATRLAPLLPPRLLLGVTRIRPVRLDRYGLVLRLEHLRSRQDTRLPFTSPVQHCGQAVDQIRALLARAATACPRRRLPTCS